MAAKVSIVQTYSSANAEKKVEVIIKNYRAFMGLVDGSIDALKYHIENDIDSMRREEKGDLGVRIRSGGMPSDPTSDTAIRNILTREAIVLCDFSDHLLDGLDRKEEYIHRAFTLRDMRRDFELFNQQLGVLGEEQKAFTMILKREIDLSGLAESKGINYESAQKMIQRCKVKMKSRMVSLFNGELD